MSISYHFPFYLLRKRYCLKCGVLLCAKTLTRIVDPNSEEARGHRMWVEIGSGDIKTITYILECPHCAISYTTMEHKDLVKERKKELKNQKGDFK